MCTGQCEESYLPQLTVRRSERLDRKNVWRHGAFLRRTKGSNKTGHGSARYRISTADPALQSELKDWADTWLTHAFVDDRPKHSLFASKFGRRLTGGCSPVKPSSLHWVVLCSRVLTIRKGSWGSSFCFSSVRFLAVKPAHTYLGIWGLRRRAK